MDNSLLTYSIIKGLNYNDTTFFPDEDTSWKYADQIVMHVDTTCNNMREIYKKNRVCITDPPYLAEPCAIFPLVEGTYKKSIEDAEKESSLASKNTAAIYQAIKDISKMGGGTAIVPFSSGKVFYTSALRLEDNVNLYLEEGATLKFTTDTRLYEGKLMKEIYGEGTDERGLTLTRFESVELMNYSPFIYAYGKKNIAITGRGTLDGQASLGDKKSPNTMTWQHWKEKCDYFLPDGTIKAKQYEAQDLPRFKLFKEGQSDIPVNKRQYGESSSFEWENSDDGFLRPNFIQPYNCQNILIEGITIINSPMWEINPVLCDSVLVQNATVVSHLHNNDGCDPESTSNMVIRGNHFDVGDDCIAIKCGRNGDGMRVRRPSFNIVIENNTFIDGHGGITIGSETTNGVKNIFSRKNEMNSCNLQSAYRFKTNYIRGGVIENLFYNDDTVYLIQNNRAVINVDMNYSISNEVKMMEKMNIFYKAFIPIFRHVVISNLKVNTKNIPDHGGKCCMQLIGFDSNEIPSSCSISPDVNDCFISDITIKDSIFIGSLQAFNMKNVENLKLINVKIQGTQMEDKVINCKDFIFSNCDFNRSSISLDIFSKFTKIENL